MSANFGARRRISPVHGVDAGRSGRKWFGNCTTSFGNNPHRQNHMICTLKFWKNIALSIFLMGGMSVVTEMAQARTFYSRNDVFSAQKRLRMKGYYRGPIDGRYNRRTVRALTDFQFDHNLAQTGRLNPKTCTMLGASCAMHRTKG
jgi:hypothetical protein